MAYGDHIYVSRGLYKHHGIDLGDGTVIHFASGDGTKGDAAIRRAGIDVFAGGGVIEVVAYGARFSPEATVARAESLLGESGYCLFANNCEHFATWCATNEHSSAQVEAVAAHAGLVTVGATAPPLGLGAVVAAGGAAAYSGPNLMSGLAAIGGTVVGGLVVLSGAAGLFAGGAMCLALRDRPTLPDDERTARHVGRYGALAGAAAGIPIVIHAVGAAGTAGYSAIGLSTGLARLGRLAFVGGMAEGVMATVLTPVLLAVAAGYVSYRVTRLVLERRAAGQARPALQW